MGRNGDRFRREFQAELESMLRAQKARQFQYRKIRDHMFNERHNVARKRMLAHRPKLDTDCYWDYYNVQCKPLLYSASCVLYMCIHGLCGMLVVCGTRCMSCVQCLRVVLCWVGSLWGSWCMAKWDIVLCGSLLPVYDCCWPMMSHLLNIIQCIPG